MSTWNIDSQDQEEKEKCVRILYAPVLFITHYALSLSVLLSLSWRTLCIALHRITIFPPSIQEPNTRERTREKKEGYLTVFLHFASKHSSTQRSDRRNPHKRHPPDADSSQRKHAKQRVSSAASAPSRAHRMLRANCCCRHCSVCYSRHSHRGTQKHENPKHRLRSSSSHCGNPSPLQTYATVHAVAIVMVMAGPSTSSPFPPAPPCPYSHSRQSCQTRHCSSSHSCDYPAFPTA